LKAGNGSRSFAQLPLQRILSQPKLNPKIAICDSPATWGEIGSFAGSAPFARSVVGEISDDGQSPS
ncbi:hypothetical protein NKH71_33025, partial [Mesorhizobium sp. M0983]|uniref:hypothetical protein n=1 Tax=Mesorhizobium sp. M0983 TaxID=2957040 RepID=UPI00333A5DDA